MLVPLVRPPLHLLLLALSIAAYPPVVTLHARNAILSCS